MPRICEQLVSTIRTGRATVTCFRAAHDLLTLLEQQKIPKRLIINFRKLRHNFHRLLKVRDVLLVMVGFRVVLLLCGVMSLHRTSHLQNQLWRFDFWCTVFAEWSHMNYRNLRIKNTTGTSHAIILYWNAKTTSPPVLLTASLKMISNFWFTMCIRSINIFLSWICFDFLNPISECVRVIICLHFKYR